VSGNEGDPLPVVPIEINGVRMNAFIDTGGHMIIVDEAIAADLGIETVSNDSGTVTGCATDVYAIISTNVLQQFLPTVDYPSGLLIMMPRNEAGSAQLNDMLANDTVLISSGSFFQAKGYLKVRIIVD